MNKIEIRKLVRLRFRELSKYYDRMKKRLGKENIHQFRVTIKKLRSFLRLLDIAYKGRKIKMTSSLKDFYHKTGKLRDIQLYLQEIRKSQKNIKSFPAEHLKKLGTKQAIAAKELRAAMQEDMLPVARKKIEGRISSGLPAAATRDFIKDRMIAVQNIIGAGRSKDVQLHTARKKLKDILYIAKSFRSDLAKPFPWPGWNSGVEKSLRHLSDTLGDFQDHRTGLAHLSEFSRAATGEEKKLLDAIQDEKKKNKNRLKAQIRKEWKEMAPLLLLQ